MGTAKDEALKMAMKDHEEIMMHAGILYPREFGKSFLKTYEAMKAALEQPTVAELNDEYLRDTYVVGLNQPVWQGLTDGEALEIYCDVQENCIKDFPSELNAAWFKAVKEKNNG